MSEILKETAIVEKRNVLNELRSKNMTLQELRFLSIYLSRINARDISSRVVRFPLNDFRKIMNLKAGEHIEYFKASIRNILQQVVEVPNENGVGYTAFQLFKRARVEKDENNEWYVEFNAHDDALPLMFDFKERYFKYELWNALRLKSSNQLRMYEILKQYEKIGRCELTVQKLREMLGINENQYSGRTGWSCFRNFVLDACQKALKQSTDICYTYESGKKGRGGKWLTVIFYIQKNEDYVDQLTLNEFVAQQPEPEPLVQTAEEIKKTDEVKEFIEEGEVKEFIEDNEAKEFIEEFEIEDETEEKMIEPYGSELNMQLARACDYEFKKEQIEIISSLICDLPIPEEKMTKDLDLGREIWLESLYRKFLAIARKKEREGEPIKPASRFNYFCRMIIAYSD